MESAGSEKRRVGWVLIAVLVVGGFVVVVVPILLLIAIPTLGSMKRAANETSAIHTVHAINLAEAQYAATYPANGFACSLERLGGDPHSGPPSAANAQMLQQDLASGVKAGYQFTIMNCTRNTRNGNDSVTGYTIAAQPITVGKTGHRGFCSDETGLIKVDPTGGTNCTQDLVR